MTSLLPHSTPAETRPRRTAAEVRQDLRVRRPLVLVATLGGVLAAAGPLLVCLALGLVGWFLTDAGGHGAPRDGLRVGALAWLMAHGSGVHVQGAAITAVPLGITLVCAWAVWRVGLRVGEGVSGHGPDAGRIADGERDWTVPTAASLFLTGYVVTAVVTHTLVTDPVLRPDLTPVVIWSVALCLGLALPAIAVGSGRAAIWTATLPPVVPAVLAALRRTLTTWLLVSAVALVGAFLLDVTTAVNVLSQLHAGAEASGLIGLVCLLMAPNAAVFSGSYLLGPGFAVGTGTLVSPAVVTIGALPMFPLLAALPGQSPTPSWTPALVVLAPLVGALGAMRAQRSHPVFRYEEGALHGGGGGILAAIGFGVLAAVAGGAVGPGRMTDVGPFAFAVLLHGIAAFGVGGILGGLIATWWQRRGLDDSTDDSTDDSAADPAADPDDDSARVFPPGWSRRSRRTPRLTLRGGAAGGPGLGGGHQPAGPAGRVR